MAEEEVVAPSASPLPSDCKRKFEDLDSEPTESNAKSNPDDNNADAAVPDDGDNKRPRLGDDLASANGHQEEQSHKPAEETVERVDLESTVTEDDASPGRNQLTSATETTTRRIDVPNNKVGVLIGKAGDTIKYLQYNSGAKIQITRDAYADPQAATRSVEPIGSSESIYKAEKLISAVIAEVRCCNQLEELGSFFFFTMFHTLFSFLEILQADAGGSPALVASGLSPAQATMGSEQIQIQAPNEKVGLIIWRGGETIKGLQMKSGAYIQVLIPQQLPEGDDSKERTVQVSNLVIKEVMGQIWLLPFPGVSIAFLM
ncbi:uncharacterized protein LOC130933733 [Arachis stenosperma]|uniref:uncharacterized protein LOC130933733 n=1 Tax=Arachis stenosperma TaxID=217475 RepID=UPI0025AD62A4|nr:uncharacterized protein LOC130933733 [Arachis stenosperma]